MNKIKIPYTGGLTIAICGLILQKLINFEISQINTIFSYAAFVCLLGILDDKHNLKIEIRILFQIIIGYLMFIENFDISSLGNFKFLGEIKLGKFSLIFTIFILMFFLNSSNYIDGIDGLCASLFINSILLILFFYGDILSSDILKLAYYFILISVVFILFNFGLFKLPITYLGNSGSLVLGFFLFCFGIVILKNYNDISKLFLFLYTPIIFFEFVSTNLSRLLRSKKIFFGGNDHIHYLISNKIGKHSCLIILNILNFILGGIFLILLDYSTILTIIAVIIFFIIFFLIRENLIKKSFIE
jgi:UDP-GlcNAc:undecaprenyl-phosphate GlcNAc-1-phosphate transferase